MPKIPDTAPDIGADVSALLLRWPHLGVLSLAVRDRLAAPRAPGFSGAPQRGFFAALKGKDLARVAPGLAGQEYGVLKLFLALHPVAAQAASVRPTPPSAMSGAQRDNLIAALNSTHPLRGAFDAWIQANESRSMDAPDPLWIRCAS